MPASLRGTVVDTSHSSNATWTASGLPSGWQPGDIAILFAPANSNIGVATPPAGWTLLGIAAATDNDAIVPVYARRLQGGDTAPTIVWGGAQVGGTRIIALQGVPVGVDLATLAGLAMFRTAGSAAASTSHPITGLVVPTGGGLALTFVAQDASAPNANTYTAPDGWTELAEQDAASDVISGIAWADLAAGTHAATWTSSPGDSAAIVAIVLPHELVVAGTYWGRWGRRTHMHAPPAGDPDEQLLHAPPSTAGFTNYSISAGSTRSSTPNSPASSYNVTMPAGARAGVRIRSCVNAVMVGGEVVITRADGVSDTGDGDRRCIEIQNMVGDGVAFLQGLKLTRGSLNVESEGDGIYITNCPTTDVYLQDIYIEATGAKDSPHDHGDCIQLFGSAGTDVVKRLFLDRVSMITDYQGGPMTWNGTLRELHLSRCDWTYDEAAAVARAGAAEGGGMVQLWGDGPAPDVITMTDCVVRGLRSSNIGMVIGSTAVTWRRSVTDGATVISNFSQLQAYAAGGGVAEAFHPNVNGGTTPALTYQPDADHYADPTNVGAGYTSPGYLP